MTSKTLAPLVIAIVCGCAGQTEQPTRMPGRSTSALGSTTGDGSTSGTVDSSAPDAGEEVDDGLPIPDAEQGCSAVVRVCAHGACDAGAVESRRPLRIQRGRVSYYGDQFHGRRTASGDRYDKRALTAASRTLPFGALVRVRRVDDPNRITIVRINDRGPFGRSGRILDLSRAAAECIGMIRAGVVEVRAEIIDWGPNGRP